MTARVYERTEAECRKAFAAIHECRGVISENEAAMWFAARYAFKHGASVYEIAEVTGVDVSVTRKRLAKVRGRG